MKITGYYIYHMRRHAFLIRAQVFKVPRYGLEPGQLYMRWTRGTVYAQRYANASAARRMAARINDQLGMRLVRVVDQWEAESIERGIRLERTRD